MSIDKTKICHQLKVLERIPETGDTISLVLEIPRTTGGKFRYKAGQFVTLFLDINGQEIRRSYSLASSPEFESNFKISIKLVPGGLGSTYLIQNIKAGDTLWVTPPAGHFCLPENIGNRGLVFYAGGSGITPIISLIKSALKLSDTTKCLLFYQNKSSDNIIFENELTALSQQFFGRLNIQHIISQPTLTWTGLSGRISNTLIAELLSKHSIDALALHYICGPEGFMTSVMDALSHAKINKAQIIKESFTVSTNQSVSSPENFELDDAAIVIGDRDKVSEPKTIEAIIDGETHIVDYKKGKTILESLLDANLNPPYSCLDGACMACIAKVQDGLVYQNDMGILTEDNLAAKECLTCQARPASKCVKVNYEIL